MTPRRSGAEFLRGTRASLPVVLGYVPACVTFGAVGVGLGLDPWVVFALSALVYAGAGQFVGANLLAAGAAGPVAVGAVALVNLRYVGLVGAFRRWAPHCGSRRRAGLFGLGLTEEVFAVATLRQSGLRGPMAPAYAVGLELAPYATTLFCTWLGIVVGGRVPTQYLPALTTSLYALLIAVLVPMARMDRRVAVAVAVAAAISPAATSLVGSTGAVLATMVAAPLATLVLGRMFPALARTSPSRAVRGAS